MIWIAGVFSPRHLVARGVPQGTVGSASDSRSVAGMILIDVDDTSSVTKVLRFVPSRQEKPPIRLSRSPKGTRMAQTYEDGAFSLFEPATGDVTYSRRMTQKNTTPVFRDEESILIVTRGGTRIATGSIADSAESDLVTTSEAIQALDCKGERLAVATRDGRITVYDSATGTKVQGLQETEKVLNIELSRDGRLLACGAPGGKLVLWRLRQRAEPEGRKESATSQKADATHMN